MLSLCVRLIVFVINSNLVFFNELLNLEDEVSVG